jgi:hypothetical protein
MACETIVVTNTLTNSICSGEYEKLPDVQQWINKNNPSCQLVKVYNNSLNKWEWVFNVVTPHSATPPPGATPVYSVYTPLSFEIETVGVDEALSCAAADTAVNTTAIHTATTATSWQTALSAGSFTKHRRCISGSLNESNFSSQVYSRILWLLPTVDSSLTDAQNLDKLYQIDFLTQNGINATIDAGYCFPESVYTATQQHFAESSRNIDYTITVKNPGNWATSYWNTTANDPFFNLIDRNAALLQGCWAAGWKLPVEVKSDTTATSECPADADWTGTGLSVLASPGQVTNLTATGCVPVAIDGYYPLYTSQTCAQQAGDGTTHTHVFNGLIYWMPNGVTNHHGDYIIPGQVTGLTAVADIQVPGQVTDLTAVADIQVPGQVINLVASKPSFTGSTEASKYKGYLFNERTNALSGPFVSEDITTVTTRDNSAEMYCVNSQHEIKKTILTDFNDPNFPAFNDPFENLYQPMVDDELGVILSESGEGFLYRGRYKSTPFSDSVIGGGAVENPIFFRDCSLAIAETNWMHLGDEHNEKQIHRVDLRFHKNSCGHLFLYVQNEEGKTKGQYKGMVKEHMKVFTNVRGRGFKLCLMIATHKDHPWALREMSIGHLYGKSF